MRVSKKSFGDIAVEDEDLVEHRTRPDQHREHEHLGRFAGAAAAHGKGLQKSPDGDMVVKSLSVCLPWGIPRGVRSLSVSSTVSPF